MATLLLRGEPIGSIKGVLFDKDGTISNSEEHLRNLARLRIQEISRLLKEQQLGFNKVEYLKELLMKAYGLTNNGINPQGTIAIASRKDNIISTATVLSLLGESWPKSLELSNKSFKLVDLQQERAPQHRPIIDGFRKILISLETAGITCALISNDTDSGIKNFLLQNNLQNSLNKFWSADNYPPKPNPKAVEALCERLNLQPSECALIGDADSDLTMAKQSGIGIAIGFTGGWKQTPQLNHHQHIINHWNELEILQKTKVQVHLDAK